MLHTESTMFSFSKNRKWSKGACSLQYRLVVTELHHSNRSYHNRYSYNRGLPFLKPIRMQNSLFFIIYCPQVSQMVLVSFLIFPLFRFQFLQKRKLFHQCAFFSDSS